MAFLFGKKKGTHREGTPTGATNPATGTTPPSSQNNSLSNLPAGAGDSGSPHIRSAAPTAGLRTHQAQNSDGATPSPNQGRVLQKQQSPPAQQISNNASLYPWSQRRLTLNSSHPSPFPRYGHAANAVSSKDGDIYIMGGLIRSQNVRGDLWMIEGNSERLESYPVMTTSEGPGPRVGHASLLVGNAFIVFGGDTKLDERDVLDETLYLLNTSTRQWSRASPHGHRPSGRYGHTLNILGSKLYIFGGQVDTVFFNDLVAFDLNTLQHVGSKWEILVPGAEGSTDVPASRTNHTIVTWKDKLFLFGGTNGVEWFNDVWSYDPQTNQWTQLDCIGFIPSPREGHAAALVNDVMYIFGGRSSDGLDLGDLAAFRISSRRWYTFQNMGPSPSPRSGHTMTTVGTKVVVLGGEPSVPTRSQEELQLVYVLDTAKIRYPSDNPSHPSPTDRNRPGGQPRAQGMRNGSLDGIAPDPRRPQKPSPVQSAPIGPAPAGGNPNPLVNNNNTSGTGPGGSRLPRASVANQPSGPPPTQQVVPPPRANGAPPAAGSRSKTPTGPAGPAVARGKENIPPTETKENSPVTANGPSNQAQVQRKDSKDGGPQQPPQVHQAPQRPTIGVRAPEDQPRFDASTVSPATTQPPPNSLNAAASRDLDTRPVVDSQEVEKLKRINDWYVSELALARRAGYTPQTSHAALFEDRGRELLAEDDRPFVEAMLALKGELSNVQAELESQSALAVKRMQDVERQRDIAVQEAVYAKAKLAALGGPATPTPGSDTASMDAEKMTDMSRKLAASLSAQADLSAQTQALTQEIAAEKKARHLADETASSAQRRITELDEYRNWAASEIETLRAETEATTNVKMLQIDQLELTARLEEVMAENKNYQTSLEKLNQAMQFTNQKSSTLERQLEEERIVKESLERKLAQLRSEYEEKTADLQSVNQRLKDAEELMATYAEEAKAVNAVLIAGLDKVAAREAPSMLASVTEERVRVLQEQVENTQVLLAKSKAQADETGEKLAEAMQRVAGLEFQQGQSSKDSIALRRRMADVGDEARRLKKENVELLNRLNQRQLEVDAVTAKHNALKEILHERSAQGGFDKRRSLTLQNSPESGTATPEQLNRLRELEARLEDSLRAHRETKNTAEMQAQEVEKHFREKLEQLENDYQSAVHYVKGTEKMLKRMKDELTKHKTANARLQIELEEAQRKSGECEKGRESSSEADWEQERELLNKEIDDLRTKVRESAMALDKQIRETKTQLDSLREERDRFKIQHSQLQLQVMDITQKHGETKALVDKLESENALLENRAQSAEQKVSMLLDQVENSVDAYRRSTRFENANGESGSARSSFYGPDNRTSVALDSLATELDALRNHWESTNKTYRLSNTFEFEKTPTTPQTDFSTNIAQWRQKLAQEDEIASRSTNNSRQGMAASGRGGVI
ncbi:hypothetical protein BDD12DRAFT_917694 [Trichophaea hybrida]|nr:hypothetical protein BDD12DRAFT_917694 [Trichophaea hybrida]